MKSVVTTVSQPSREDVLARLGELLDGKIDREQVSTWASRLLAEDDASGTEVQVTDFAAWETLVSIAAANLFGGDRPYLYDESDFASWAAKLATAPK